MRIQDIKLTPLMDTLQLLKIDDATYFSSKYSSYISNSRLGLLNPKQDGSPEKFFEGFKSGGFNQSFALGSAVHELVLQPEYFELAPDMGKPTAKLGAMADELFKVYLQKDITKNDIIKASDIVDYYKGKITDDRFKDVVTKCTPYWEQRKKEVLDISQNKEMIYLDHKSREITISCVESLKSNKYAMDLLHPTGIVEDPIVGNEQAILLDVQAVAPNGETTILHLKSKLDNYTIDTETNTITVNDVKTIGNIVSAITDNIKRFHYSRELAMYLYLLKLCAAKFYNLENPKIQANYLVVSTVPNFYSSVKPAEMDDLLYGFKEFKVLLQYTAHLIFNNNYSLDGATTKYKL